MIAENRRSLTIKQILILAVAVIVIIGIGCSKDDKITSDTIQTEIPVLSFTIDDYPEGVEPGDTVAITVFARSRFGKIERIIYSFAGMVNFTDIIVYAYSQSEVEEKLELVIPLEGVEGSSVILQVSVFDDAGNKASLEQRFYPLDNVPPEITLFYNNFHLYVANDTLAVDITASDNVALTSITLTTAGAFARVDTIHFSYPYPVEIDTQVYIPIPDTAFFSLEFWVDAEAVDGNFNSAIAESMGEVDLIDIYGPILEMHPLGGQWVSIGDSARFWVVGRDNVPLSCLGYSSRRQNYYGGFDYYYADSIINGDFAAVDSIYCAFYVSEEVYNDNFIWIDLFGYDTSGNHNTLTPSLQNPTHFRTEGRIKISKAEFFSFNAPGYPRAPVVDNIRERVYLPLSDLGYVAVYSMDRKEFLNPIPVDGGPATACITADGDRLLVLKRYDSSLAVIDLTESQPTLERSIPLPGSEYAGIVEALSNNKAYILLNFGNDFIELDLGSYELQPVAWGMPGIRNLSASGDKNVLFFCNNWVMGLFDSRTNDVTLGNVDDDWQIPYSACNHSGTRFYCGGWDIGAHDAKSLFIDASLSVFDSLPQLFNAGAGVFSSDENDFFFTSFFLEDQLGLFDFMSGEVKEWSYMAPHWENGAYIYNIGTNVVGTRLFVLAQNPENLIDLYFYDIPVEP